MSNWADVELGDIVTLHRGYDLPSSQRREGSVPIVSSSGVTGYHDEAKIEPRGVVTGRYGTLGEVFYLEEPFWPLNTTLYVSDFHGNDERFVSYLLRCQELGARNSAAAVPGVNRNVLHRLPARRPPLPTQRKIAAILSAYDDLIENNNRRIKLLEEMAQRIYRQWFVDFQYPGNEDVPLADSELGPIPEGWSLVTLDAMAALVAVSVAPSQRPTQEFQHFSIPAFDEGRLPTIDEGSAIRSNKFRVDGPCVLYSKLNPRIPRVWWADPVPAQPAVSSTELLPLVSRNGISRAYLFALVASEEFAERTVGMAAGTSTSHQRVRPSDLLRAQVIRPDRAVMEGYTRVAEPMWQLAQRRRWTNRLLRSTRDLLLPRLISGEIDVDALNIIRGEAVV